MIKPLRLRKDEGANFAVPPLLGPKAPLCESCGIAANSVCGNGQTSPSRLIAGRSRAGMKALAVTLAPFGRLSSRQWTFSFPFIAFLAFVIASHFEKHYTTHFAPDIANVHPTPMIRNAPARYPRFILR